MKKFIINNILAGILICACVSINAASNSLRQYNNSAGIAAIAQHMNYKEISLKQGRETVDDKNQGTIPGLGLIIRHQFNFVYTEFSMTAAQGLTPYNGKTQRGNIEINNNDTPSLIFDEYGAIGIIIQTASRFAFIPYFLVGYHNWERSNEPSFTNGTFTAGDDEHYQNNYYAGGLRLELLLGQSFIISAYGNAGSTFNQSVYSPRTQQAGTDQHVGATFRIQSKPWYKAGFNIDLAASPCLHVFATVEYTAFRYGLSPKENGNPSDPNSGSDEPDSRTHYWVGMLGIAYDERFADDTIHYALTDNSISQFNNRATLGFLVRYQKYTLDPLDSAPSNHGGITHNENINTGTLKGNLLGGTLDIAKTFGDFTTRALAEFTDNDAHYDSNNVTPPISTENANIYHYRAQISLGYLGTLNPRLAIAPFVPIGYQHDTYIIRKNEFNISQANLYKYFYVGLGVALNWQVSNRLIIAPNVAAGVTFDNYIYVPIARLQFRPNPDKWYQVGLLGDLNLTAHLHITTSLNYRYTEFNKSSLTFATGNNKISGIMPSAATHSLTFMLGLSYPLGG